MHLIVDSNYLCHKTRHGMHDVELTNENINVEVIFGFLGTLLKVSKRFNIDDWSFVWDSKKSWREKEYPKYKSFRKEMREKNIKEMTAEEVEINNIQYKQFDVLRFEVLPALGFVNNFFQIGIEGDDLIAMITMSYPNKEFLIMSTDKDLYQLITKNVSTYSEHTKKITDYKTFVDTYGIEPEQWGLAKCIGGCDTDSVPGISGCGDPAKSEKSRALTYIKGEMKRGVIYKRIISDEGQEIIERNKKLVVLPHEKTRQLVLRKRTLFAKDFIATFERYNFMSFLRSASFRDWEYSFNLM